MSEVSPRRAAAIAGPLILAIVSALFGLALLISTIVGLPFSLELPVIMRALGIVIIAAGMSVIGWAFKNRSPSNVISSTYVTLAKLFGRMPLAEKEGRTEPLVVSGPQKYVRSPLYFGVLVMVLGWALLTTYSFVFVAVPVLLVWFGLVLVPFEERELDAIFGAEWENYAGKTPMLIPFTKRRKKVQGS